LIFGAFTLLVAFKSNNLCSKRIILVFVIVEGFLYFFFNEWLYAETKDMKLNFWKHLVRNLQGLTTAFVMLSEIQSISLLFTEICDMGSHNRFKFFWIFGVIASVVVTFINVLVYGPFIDAIGFLFGCIIALIVASMNDYDETGDD